MPRSQAFSAAFGDGSGARDVFGAKEGAVFPLADSAPHDYSQTIDPTVPSCAFQGAGHWGPMFGPEGTPIHWWHAMHNLDLSEKCLTTSCENVVSWCCFTRWLHVFVWYIDALRRNKLGHILTHGSLIGAARSGSMPPCHYDAEVLVFVRTPSDEARLEAVVAEAEAALHVTAFNYGNHLFADGYMRTDSYPLRPCKVDYACAGVHDGGTDGKTNMLSHSPFEKANPRCTCGSGDTAMYKAYESARKGDHVYLFPHDDIFPLRKCNLYGMEVNCPRRASYFNALSYGSIAGSRTTIATMPHIPVGRGENLPANASWWTSDEFTDFVDTEDKCMKGKYSAKRQQLFASQHVPAQAASITCLYDNGYVSLLDDWNDQSKETQKAVIEDKGFDRLLPAIDPTTWKLGPRQPYRYDRNILIARLKKENAEHPGTHGAPGK